MKKLSALLAIVLMLSVVSCERTGDPLSETSKNDNHELTKQPNAIGQPTDDFTPEDVDPKDITPPRR